MRFSLWSRCHSAWHSLQYGAVGENLDWSVSPHFLQNFGNLSICVLRLRWRREYNTQRSYSMRQFIHYTKYGVGEPLQINALRADLNILCNCQQNRRY